MESNEIGIQVDFENTPESFLARVDYRETGGGGEGYGQAGQGELQAGELVFCYLREDYTGTGAGAGAATRGLAREVAGRGLLC